MNNWINVGVIQVNNKSDAAGRTDALEGQPQSCVEIVGEGRGVRGDVQSQAYPMDKAAPAYQIALHLFIIITTVKSLNNQVGRKQRSWRTARVGGERKAEGGEGVEKLANSNMQANSAHFLRGARESPANWNYYLLDNHCKAQEGGEGRERDWRAACLILNNW